MDKSKIIPIILLVIILVVGYFAFTFYTANKALTDEKLKLEDTNKRLFQERSDFESRAVKLDAENRELAAKQEEVQRELTRVESERATLQKKYDDVSQQRDALVEKLKSKSTVTATDRPESPDAGMPSVPNSDEYWIDFVKTKAKLEAQVDSLNKDMLDAKNKLAGMDKEAKELSIKIDELTKEKERLANDISFKERTLSIMSRDLVTEREGRKIAIEELNKLRSENVTLKRELIMGNKEKMQLQTAMKDTLEKKDSLEKRIGEIDRVLREKAITLEELQEQMKTAVKGGKAVIARESASVELPPIVVKPGVASGLRGIKGETIAVNEEEKFIIVNLGEASGVRPGVQMAVLRGDREIGTVEIIETRRDISAADIREVVSGFTIQKGDLVVSK
ncbi:MAG: hypothetical protein ABH865_08755 [Candidatus Omnitrophota bacterium]|nr:hypothetical protein [Candidatus Omnitrophota bacterium]